MKPGQVSRTAEYQAAFRAFQSSRRPASARLFTDPFALDVLPPDLRRLVRLARFPVLGAYVRWRGERTARGAMSSGIARTRLIDDWLKEGLADGIRQVVLLGAGFDFRPYRLPELADCRVIEIDHPATQPAKQEQVARLLGRVPDHVTFVAADLTRDDLRAILESLGMAAARVIYLCEGVMHYLGAAAVDGMLRAIATSSAAASRLVFTYLHGGLLDGSTTFDGAHLPMSNVASAGEPWLWGLAPPEMPAFLAERGFTLTADVGADEYRARYWGERGRRMRGFGFYRVAQAVVVRDGPALPGAPFAGKLPSSCATPSCR
jgi:methyltransferase (TIGR00027 family)